jgi:hypothetical protein
MRIYLLLSRRLTRRESILVDFRGGERKSSGVILGLLVIFKI